MSNINLKRKRQENNKQISKHLIKENQLFKKPIKCVDYSISETCINTTNTNGDMHWLNETDTGSAFYNRIGNKIKLLTLRITGAVQFRKWNNGTAGSSDTSLLRLTTILMKQALPSMAKPVFSDVFAVTSKAGVNTSYIFSPLNQRNSGNYRILADDYIKQTPMDMYGTSNMYNTTLLSYDRFIDLRKLNIITQYNADSGSTAMQSNLILFVLRIQGHMAGGTLWSDTAFLGSSRLRFEDA